MKDTFICLDVGGTEIKAASIDRQGRLQREIRHFPARAEEEAEAVLEHMAGIIRSCGFSDAGGGEIRMAFPGPFDYDRGICLMQGLGKYDKLYGINLRKALAALLGTEEERICFLNDASAFALGEMGFGEARGAARALFICIGTGCGSAFGMTSICIFPVIIWKNCGGTPMSVISGERVYGKPGTGFSRQTAPWEAICGAELTIFSIYPGT